MWYFEVGDDVDVIKGVFNDAIWVLLDIEIKIMRIC